MTISRVTRFKDKGLDILVLHVTKCAFVEVDVMSTKENHLIVDSGGTAYGRELGNLF